MLPHALKAFRKREINYQLGVDTVWSGIFCVSFEQRGQQKFEPVKNLHKCWNNFSVVFIGYQHIGPLYAKFEKHRKLGRGDTETY